MDSFLYKDIHPGGAIEGWISFLVKKNNNKVVTIFDRGRSSEAWFDLRADSSVMAVKSVSLSSDKISLAKGARKSLVATILPKDATNKNLTWASSNPSVVKVDKNGNLEVVSVGKAIIIAITEVGSVLNKNVKMDFLD